MAPAKDLQGLSRLQELTSSPRPDTHVRFACADAISGSERMVSERINGLRLTGDLNIGSLHRLFCARSLMINDVACDLYLSLPRVDDKLKRIGHEPQIYKDNRGSENKSANLHAFDPRLSV